MNLFTRLLGRTDDAEPTHDDLLQLRAALADRMSALMREMVSIKKAIGEAPLSVNESRSAFVEALAVGEHEGQAAKDLEEAEAAALKADSTTETLERALELRKEAYDAVSKERARVEAQLQAIDKAQQAERFHELRGQFLAVIETWQPLLAEMRTAANVAGLSQQAPYDLLQAFRRAESALTRYDRPWPEMPKRPYVRIDRSHQLVPLGKAEAYKGRTFKEEEIIWQ